MLEVTLYNDIRMKVLEKRDTENFFKFIEKGRQGFEKWILYVSKVKTVEETDSLIQKFLDSFKSGKGYYYGIWDKKTIIGFVCIKDINQELKTAEIGYMIDKDYEGKGIIKKTCDMMIKFIFMELGFEKITICCDVRNDRSIEFPKRYGFKHEGTLRRDMLINNEACDIMYWGLLKEEYEIKGQ